MENLFDLVEEYKTASPERQAELQDIISARSNEMLTQFPKELIQKWLRKTYTIAQAAVRGHILAGGDTDPEIAAPQIHKVVVDTFGEYLLSESKLGLIREDQCKEMGLFLITAVAVQNDQA